MRISNLPHHTHTSHLITLIHPPPSASSDVRAIISPNHLPNIIDPAAQRKGGSTTEAFSGAILFLKINFYSFRPSQLVFVSLDNDLFRVFRLVFRYDLLTSSNDRYMITYWQDRTTATTSHCQVHFAGGAGDKST